jgi:transcriptional regulator with XRE-family HTH domain
LREDARLTGKELAVRLGWAPSKVSRIENGKQTATADDVVAWTAAVGAGNKTRDDLLADLRTVRFEYATWRRQLRSGIAQRQRANLPLEAEAELVRVFTPEMVPGLLQTAEYARHVFALLASLHHTPPDVESGVRTRLQRQQVLYEPDKHFQFLLTEAALRYRIAPPSVMRGQLDRLTTLAGLDTVNLAVLPFSTQLPVVTSHSFTMFDDKLVLVELTGAELAFRDRDEVALYSDAFERLWKAAETGTRAVELVNETAAHIGG